MNMKFGINKTNLSKAFIARDKEIFADSRDREKKKRSTKVLKKKSTKVGINHYLKIFTVWTLLAKIKFLTHLKFILTKQLSFKICIFLHLLKQHIRPDLADP